MALETATFIDSLVETNPTGSDDRSTSDDHHRLIKASMKRTFPNVTDEVRATAVNLNFLTGVAQDVQSALNSLSAGQNTVSGSLAALAASVSAINTRVGTLSASMSLVQAGLVTVEQSLSVFQVANQILFGHVLASGTSVTLPAGWGVTLNGLANYVLDPGTASGIIAPTIVLKGANLFRHVSNISSGSSGTFSFLVGDFSGTQVATEFEFFTFRKP